MKSVLLAAALIISMQSAYCDLILSDHFTSYGAVVNTAPPGWTKTPGSGILGPDSSTSTYIQEKFYATSPGSDGDTHFVSGHQLGAVREGFQRSIEGLSIGIEYTISFDYASSTSVYSGLTSPAYWDILLDGSVVDSSSPIALQSSNPISWSSHMYSFTATSNTHSIGFNPRGTTGDTTAYFDNFALSSAVPEPASAVLLFTGFVSIVAIRYRRDH